MKRLVNHKIPKQWASVVTGW